MENKVKFIIFGLVAILAASLFVAYQSYSSKEELLKDKEKLSEENSLLNNKISRIEGTLRENDNKISVLNMELDKAARTKKELESRYEMARKAEDELSKEIKSLRAQAKTVQPVTQAQIMPFPAASTDDGYWASLIKDNKDLILQLERIREELKSARLNATQLQREKSTIELDLNNLKQDNEELNGQLQYNQKISDSIAQELVREKNDKARIETNLKAIKNENVTLAKQLKNLNKQKMEMENKLQLLQQDKSALDTRLDQMQARLSERVSKITQLKDQLEGLVEQKEENAESGQKESVELAPIVVRAQAQAADSVSASGVNVSKQQSLATSKILAINRENNFVVIDLGESSGIKLGDILGVYRDGEKIATIETIQTRKNISACDIQKEDKSIAIGDIVK